MFARVDSFCAFGNGSRGVAMMRSAEMREVPRALAFIKRAVCLELQPAPTYAIPYHCKSRIHSEGLCYSTAARLNSKAVNIRHDAFQRRHRL
jgi:hypothetical protein